MWFSGSRFVEGISNNYGIPECFSITVKEILQPIRSTHRPMPLVFGYWRECGTHGGRKTDQFTGWAWHFRLLGDTEYRETYQIWRVAAYSGKFRHR